MIDVIDATFKDTPDESMVQISELLQDLPIKAINWWNTNHFPVYLQKIHKNPWEILENLQRTLSNAQIIIDVKGNQLNKTKTFSDEIIDKYLSQFAGNDKIIIKIFDPLNELSKIEKISKLASKHNLKVIGGIFLRPDLNNFPECHLNLINFYKDQKISNISLIEPLGLLKIGDIEKIKTIVDKNLQNNHINLSFKHVRMQQILLVQEAVACGITEFDYSLFEKSFGYPTLEAIYNSLTFMNKALSEISLPVHKYHELLANIKQKNLLPIPLKDLDFNYFEDTRIPVEVFQSIMNLRYFTNLTEDLPTILSTVKKVQDELGNPPLIDPFLTIITSQTVFRLQNSHKGIESLDTLKYISGFWGTPVNELKGEFKGFVKTANHLSRKTKLFSPMDQFQEKLQENLDANQAEIKEDKDKLLFLFSPEEAKYFFREYEPRPKIINFRDKKNLAVLVKTILENKKLNEKELVIRNEPQTEQDSGEFRWRYLSRLFQIGKF